MSLLDTLAAPEPAADGQGPDPRSASQRLADAFVETFRRVQLDGGLPSAGGDRRFGSRLLRRGIKFFRWASGGRVNWTPRQAGRAQHPCACDAQVILAVLGGESQLVDLGRARRTFDGPVMLVVIARDRGCVHPGCGRPPRWCDVHHVLPWWDGGKTSLHNGVLLCGFHHKLYDDGIWHLRFAPDGHPECIPPTWIDPQQRPRRHQRHHETDRT